MSNQIKDKQVAPDNKREFDADALLNQHIFKTLTYTGMGFGIGMLSSLMFKRKAAFTLLGAGAGAGYGISNFLSDYQRLQHYKDFNAQPSSQTLNRQSETSNKDWEQFMPKQENLTQQKQHQRGGSDDDSDSKSKDKARKEQSGTVKDTSEQRDPHTPKPSEKKNIAPQQDSNRKEESSSKSSPKDKESTKPQSLSKVPSEEVSPKQATPTAYSTQNRSSHDRTNDKSSQEFGKNKDMPKTSSSHDRTNDKSSQEFGKNKDVSKTNPSNDKTTDQSNKFFGDDSKSDWNLKAEGKVNDQQFQNFKSNTKEPSAPVNQKDAYHENSKRRSGDLENKVESHRVEQDRGKSTAPHGDKNKKHAMYEGKAGGQFSGHDLTAGSQVNTVLE